MADNPFAVLIPCRRVMHSDATPGRLGAGTELKPKLIGFERSGKDLVITSGR